MLGHRTALLLAAEQEACCRLHPNGADQLRRAMAAIDELIPARYRGRVDLTVNGSFWLGAAVGSGASLVFLNPNVLPTDIGWRLGFAIGGILGFGIILLRGYVPESPRWLVIHGRKQEADAAMNEIEHRVRSAPATISRRHAAQ